MGSPTEIYATFVMTVVAEEVDGEREKSEAKGRCWRTARGHFTLDLAFLPSFWLVDRIPGIKVWFACHRKAPNSQFGSWHVNPSRTLSPGVHKLDSTPNGNPLTTPGTGCRLLVPC